MEVATYNYKSDFDFILKVRDRAGREIDLTGYDWTAKFYTSSKAMAYVASMKNGECVNCRVDDDGRVRIVADNHGLPVGQLQCELSVAFPDEVYPDGTRDVVTPDPVNIWLVNGKGDSDRLERSVVEVVLPLVKGDKGEPFRYEDFTEEQLEALRGPAGKDGRNGIDGKDGADGVDGKDGADGRDGEKGEKGDTGDKGDKGDKGDAFTYEDFTPEQLASLKGEKGEDGKDANFTTEIIESTTELDGGVPFFGVPIVEQSGTEVTIEPNVLNRWGEVASLTLNFKEVKPNNVAEYMIEFVSGETPTTLSLPSDVKFPYDVEIEPNMRYQLSVMDNMGLIVGVEL